MKIKVSKIKYSIESDDDENVINDLPKSLTITMDDDEYDCLMADNDLDDFETELGDIITETTDFCVKSFEYKIV